jgi:glycosyltransferase involved in cell wall biosynthesis
MGRTWVVIPMHNEAEVIESVIVDVKAKFDHVVCVDDGSSDDSVNRARAAGAVVVVHPINLGQGASLQTGFDYALSDVAMTEIVTFDADGQHSVDDALSMRDMLREKKLDAVIGSRFLDNRTSMSFAKKILLKMAVVFGRISTGMALTDAHNGLRVLDRNLLSRIRIKQNRMAHASEIVELISNQKASWAEYPTQITYTEYSKAKGQPLLNSVNILVELLLK